MAVVKASSYRKCGTSALSFGHDIDAVVIHYYL